MSTTKITEDRRNRSTRAIVAVLALGLLSMVTVACGAPAPSDRQSRPFSPFSMWNFPIGPRAQLVPSGIGVPREVHADVSYVIPVSASDPVRPVFLDDHNFGGGRCTPDRPSGRSVRVPDKLFIRDAQGRDTPNHALVLIQPDGSILEFSVAARCLHDAAGRQPNEPGYTGAVDFNLYAVPAYTPGGRQTLDGSGEQGARGASGLSSLGGTIRAGELFSDQPITHALAVNLWAARLLYYGSDRPGFRWPTWRADGYAPGTYGGGNRALVIGSLLTIPKNVTASSLGITTKAGRKVFAALQTYGAYVVEDSFYDDVDFGLDAWADLEYKVRTGSGFGLDATGAELRRAISATYVVDNNAPGNLGGGGQFDALVAAMGSGRR